MKKGYQFLILVFLLFLPFCSVRTAPSRTPLVRAIVFKGPKVEINGRNALIKVGKKKLRFSGKITISTVAGKSYFSIELGRGKDPVALSPGEGDFVVKKGETYLLLHGKFLSKKEALEEISKIGRGIPVLLWERNEFPLRISLGNKTLKSSIVSIIPGEELLSINNNPYRGSLLIKEAAKGLEVINIVDIESFLAGCRPGILRYSSNFEALKAQAVVLRTLALEHEGKIEGRNFSYYGVEKESPVFVKAVRATRGEVITFKNSLAHTPYSLSCGGETEDGGLPYLKRVKCWDRPWIIIKSESSHFGTGINLVEALGLFTVEDPDAPITKSEAQQWLWSFSSFIKAGKFFPLDDELKISFLRALGQTIMLIKPAQTVEPLEYLIDLGIIDEDTIREKGFSQGDAAIFIYNALRALGKIRWENGEVRIKNGEVYVKGERIEDVKLFRNGNIGFTSAEKEILLDGEPIKFLRNTKGKISALEENGYSGDGEEIIWRKRYRADLLEKRLKEYIPLDDLQDLKIVKKTETGRVLALEVVGNESSYILRGSRITEALALPSNLFIIDREYDEDGNISGYFFCGRGNGEGIGMCAFGANRMAEEGKTYKEILSFYYQKTEIRGNYGRVKRGKK